MYRNQLIAPYPLADDFVPYNLRHTYCTDLQKKGIDIRTAQYLMGHSDISLTANIYTHADNSTILEAARLINGTTGTTLGTTPQTTLNHLSAISFYINCKILKKKKRLKMFKFQRFQALCIWS